MVATNFVQFSLGHQGCKYYLETCTGNQDCGVAKSWSFLGGV